MITLTNKQNCKRGPLKGVSQCPCTTSLGKQNKYTITTIICAVKCAKNEQNVAS